MRVLLLTVGRMKAGPERDLAARYLERAQGAARSVGLSGIDLRECEEGRSRQVDERRAAEGSALRQFMPPNCHRAVLDERGTSWTSEAFAADIGGARDRGASAYVLAIGGPDGLDPALRGAAERCLAFGAMTWPHQLVRIMAAEQIYRAVTILAGHPYHRR